MTRNLLLCLSTCLNICLHCYNSCSQSMRFCRMGQRTAQCQESMLHCWLRCLQWPGCKPVQWEVACLVWWSGCLYHHMTSYWYLPSKLPILGWAHPCCAVRCCAIMLFSAVISAETMLLLLLLMQCRWLRSTDTNVQHAMPKHL